MDVVISGASGLIGSSLVEALRAGGHRPIRLVRRPAGAGAGAGARADEIAWDPAAGSIDAPALEGTDAVVHLAGAGIAEHRWTDDYKLEILRSRTTGTVTLATALAKLDRPPGVLVSGSAIGYYGDRGDELLDEQSAPGDGFLPEVCVAWEAATAPAADAGIRVARIRTGIVLTADGGALKKQLPLFKLGAGGKFGNGRQWQSWIALEDEIGAIVHLLTAEVSGAVNLTAPNPVTNATFTKTLADVLHRPAFLPIPSFGPKVVLGRELAENLLFDSQRVLPKVLQQSGYTFRYPDLESALRAAVGKPAA